MITRHRESSIVEFSQGILLVSENGSDFMLPGGGMEIGVLEGETAKRELFEETGLVAIKMKFLFDYSKNHLWNNKPTISKTKVFLVEVNGFPYPKGEIVKTAFYNPGCNLKLTSGSKLAIEKYFSEFREKVNL